MRLAQKLEGELRNVDSISVVKLGKLSSPRSMVLPRWTFGGPVQL
jgi:hypothetical protein